MSGALVPYPWQPQQQQVPNHQCQLICGGCRTMLVYPYGSIQVRCALCSFVTNVPPQVAHINCGSCGVTLMYPAGAHAVRCATCTYITCPAPVAAGPNQPRTETVIVENPMTIDDSGQIVSSLAVGVTTRPP